MDCISWAHAAPYIGANSDMSPSLLKTSLAAQPPSLIWPCGLLARGQLLGLDPQSEN